MLVFKACRNLASPYLKHVLICCSSRATPRFIILPNPRANLFKSEDLHIFGRVPLEFYPNSNNIQFSSVQNTLLSVAIITSKRKYFFVHTISATLISCMQFPHSFKLYSSKNGGETNCFFSFFFSFLIQRVCKYIPRCDYDLIYTPL